MRNVPNEPDLEAVPSATTVVVDCSQVALKTHMPDSPSGPDTAPWRLLRDGGRVTLFRDADARIELGRVRGHSAARILGSSGNLTHVSGGGDGYAFDGWVRSEDLTEDASMGIGVVLGMRLDDAFRPRGGDVAVRMKADRAAPVVMALAPEAVVHKTGEEGDFTAVEITGLASDGPRYFVLRAELEPYRPAASRFLTAPH